ncbi:drug resistance protein [Microdochium trichocladiopsis]|uniref:Drug resistance protein n=1 Tax=Microdochium trichocladiopsis TaxID=1682393 RepID=A0A9P8YGV0_9PEZI|nr:drug resistance protein [Microdochium trichocladiopsis]KAH7039757.1 drug resistance protein [Microdochium trichocladiopsis]
MTTTTVLGGHEPKEVMPAGLEAPTTAGEVPVPTLMAETEAEAVPEDDELARSDLPFSKLRCILLVLTLAGAGFLNTLSVQIVVIILPSIGDDLGIPETRLQWVVSAYSLAFACCLLLWGRIADLVGKRLIFVAGSAFVALTMIINPFLTNEIAFDLFRGLQGVGAAANVPTAIGILGVTFKPGKAKNYAFSTYAAGAPLGAVIGNLIAGLIASYANWRWVFGATAGLAILVTIAGLLVIPRPPPNSAAAAKEGLSFLKDVDWIGGALITLALLAMLFALTEGNVVGWSTVWIYMLMIISLLLTAIFAGWQLYQEKHLSHTRTPLMKVTIFRNGKFVAAMTIMGIMFGAFSDLLVYATYFWQDYQALSAIETTLRFIPTSAFGLITAFVMSHLISRVPTWIMLCVGTVCVSVACMLLAVPVPDNMTYFAVGFPSMILGVIGADVAWPTLVLFTSKTLPEADQAMGGALINASGMFGRAIALAITTAVQSAVMARERGVGVEDAGSVVAWDYASLQGIRAGNWFNCGFGLLGTLLVCVAFRGTGIVGKVDKPPLTTTSTTRASSVAEGDEGADEERGGAGRIIQDVSAREKQA